MSEKKRKGLYGLVFIIQLISIIVIAIVLYYIYVWYTDNKNTDKVLENIFDNVDITSENVNVDEIETSMLKIDFDSLISFNSDTIGWIRVWGTDINYPVVQTNDNSFYLTHSFDKSYNKAGWIFADYTNSTLKDNQLDKNTVIYGHNRQNKSMFGTLSNTLKKEWGDVEKNRYINFSTREESMLWEVFSAYTIDSEEYYIKTNFLSDEEYERFLKTIKARSIYDFNIDVTTNDKILTLSTCTNIGQGRSVVHAKLMK